MDLNSVSVGSIGERESLLAAAVDAHIHGGGQGHGVAGAGVWANERSEKMKRNAHSGDLRVAADSGIPLVEKKPNHKISLIFKEIAKKVKESFL